MNRKIRTWVEISLNDLEHNYREISSRLPDGCQMLGVCKANAYGHGAVRVAQRLQRAGCQWIAVNCYDEAEELRAAGVTMNILLLDKAVDFADAEAADLASLFLKVCQTQHNFTVMTDEMDRTYSELMKE